MKLLYLDTETTGFDKNKHDIIEMSFLIDIDGKIEEDFTLYCRPAAMRFRDISEKALKINGYTLEEIKGLASQGHAFRELTNILQDYVSIKSPLVPAGYNVQFDLRFLQAFYYRNAHNHAFPFSHYISTRRQVDVLKLARSYGATHGLFQSKSCRLADIAKALGVTVDDSKLHGSKYDTKLTRQVHLELKKRGRKKQ